MTTTVRNMLFVGDVCVLLKVSRATIERMQKEKSFPVAHTVRGRRVWFADEIAAWQEALPAWSKPRRWRKEA